VYGCALSIPANPDYLHWTTRIRLTEKDFGIGRPSTLPWTHEQVAPMMDVQIPYLEPKDSLLEVPDMALWVRPEIALPSIEKPDSSLAGSPAKRPSVPSPGIRRLGIAKFAIFFDGWRTRCHRSTDRISALMQSPTTDPGKRPRP